MGSVKVRSVMFKTGRFPFKEDQFVCTTCQEVVFRYLTMTSPEVLPDKMVTVYDKTGSVSDKL